MEMSLSNFRRSFPSSSIRTNSLQRYISAFPRQELVLDRPTAWLRAAVPCGVLHPRAGRRDNDGRGPKYQVPHDVLLPRRA